MSVDQGSQECGVRRPSTGLLFSFFHNHTAWFGVIGLRLAYCFAAVRQGVGCPGARASQRPGPRALLHRALGRFARALRSVVLGGLLSAVSLVDVATHAVDRCLACDVASGFASDGVPEETGASASHRQAADPHSGGCDAAGIVWYDDYHAAMDAAQASGRYALLWFVSRTGSAADEVPSQQVLTCPEIVARVRQDCVCARLDCEVVVASGGQPIRLLAHPAFAELHELPGLALVDMRDEASPFFRQVVSVWPLRRPLVPQVLLAMLDLPPGTLTQRTLLLALRLHADQPASTSGHWSWTLCGYAAEHAQRQAALGVQGHHDWPRRFEAINAQLPLGLVAREVCAESWPGQDLWEAAEECVRSWRSSEGHWNIVSSRPALFGYDMQRSSRGIWYAAGLVAGPP